MKSGKDFWTGVAAKYAARPIWNEEAYEATLERIRAYLPEDARVLELGCGTGGTALRLAGDAAEIVATDFADGMIAEAEKREGAPNLRFLVADVFDPRLEPGGFDVVLALNVLHLMEETDAVYPRIAALLREGGIFISKTPSFGEPNLGWKLRLLRRAVPLLQWLGKAPFLRLVTRTQVEAEIAAGGFEIVETGDYPAHPPNHFVVARKV